MKTVRFAKIVENCGEPETHLILMDPAKDRSLQAAVKAQRVMTVFQEAVGAKADRGEIGFQPGSARQFLVFPKSLQEFVGCAVVGIKYDLLHSPEVPEGNRAAPPSPRKKSKPKPTPPVRRKEQAEPETSKNVVTFKPREDEDEDEEIAELKKQVRHAMAVLEDGKPVAAFNLLKRIVND